MKRKKPNGRSRREPQSVREADPRAKSMRPRLELLEQRIAPAVLNWVGPATGGDWSTAADWSTGKVPGASDTASIGSGYSVAFSTGDTGQVEALDLNGTLDVNGGNLTIGSAAGTHFTLATGGTVSGTGSLVVNDGASNTWSGGTMTGTGSTTIASGGTLALSGSTETLAGGWILEGAGAASLTGQINAGTGGGTLNLSTLQWSSTGEVDLVGNTLTNAGGITLINTSTVVHLASNNYYSGGNSYDLGGTFINTGTIIQQGAASLEMFDNTTLSNQGTYNFAADSDILYGNSGSTESFVNMSTGNVEKTAGTGTSSIEIPFDNQGGKFDAESGTLDSTDGGTNTGGTYIANGTGVVDLTGGASPTFTGSYSGSGTGRVQMASGTFAIGSAGATFDFPSGLFVFSGGKLSGALTNVANGFITATGGTLSGTLTNQGTIVQPSGTLSISGNVSNANVYNIGLAASGTATSGSGTFTNTSSGTLELTTNVTATLGGPFANQGGLVETTAAVTGGTLVLGGGGTSTGGSYDATAAGGAIDLAGADTSVFTGTYTGTGNGVVELSLGGGIAPGAAGATLDFTAEPFQVSNGGFNVQGNTLTNAGTITLTNPSGTSNALYANNYYTGNPRVFDLGGTLINTGTIIQQGAGSLVMDDDTVLNNQGMYRFAADSDILYGSGSTNSFVNTGTVQNTAATGTSIIEVPFNNQGGTVDAESGILESNDGGANTGGTYIANGTGVVDLTGGRSPTFTGTYTGSGTGRVQLASGTFAGSGAVLDFTSGVLVVSGGTLSGTVTNAATGFITVKGGTLSATLTNQGTITQPSGTWSIGGSLNNAGIYDIALTASGIATTGAGTFTNASSGTLELTTNFTATLGSPFANQGGLVETAAASTAGVLVLNGGGASTGGSYDAVAAGAAIDVAGSGTSVWTGTYDGIGAGAVELSLGGSIAPGAAGATLDFTAELFRLAKGGINLQGDTLTNAGTITLINPTTTTLGLYANNYYTTSPRVSDLGGILINTGTVVQEGAGSLEMYDNTTLGNQGTYQFVTDSDILNGSATPSDFVNTGAGIVAKTAGAETASIKVPFNNQGGTVDAESGTLELSDGGVNTGGTYIANGSGIVDLTGGSSPTFTGTYNGSGTGAVRVASGTLIMGTGGAIFNFPGGLFTWSGGTFTGALTNATTGFIPFSNVSATGTLDNLGTVTQSGGSLNAVNGGTFTETSGTTNLVNNSTFTADAGTVNLGGGTGGTLTENSATVNVVSGTFTGLNVLTGTGGAYNFTGIATNNGTIELAGTAANPAYSLDGGTIDAGTLSTTNGADLLTTQSGGTLDGVELAGTLFTGLVVNTYVDVEGGLSLASSGLITMQGNGEVDFLGSQSLSGTGTVDFDDSLVITSGVNPTGLKGLYVPNSGDLLTIASGVTVHGITGFVGSTTGGSVTNDGTIAADGGGKITVQDDTNYTGGTLNGGSWQVEGASTLDLVGAGITTNAASILLSGSSAQLNESTNGTKALATFLTNAAGGSFTVENGAAFTSAGAFVNAGTVIVDSGSTFAPAGTGASYTQTGGVTELASGALGAAGISVNIGGGSLSGPGTIRGNLTNAGEVDLGSAAGTLNVVGTYTQTAAGTLTLEVGGPAPGTQFDQVVVTGAAALGGTLDASLTGGFGPAYLETFSVIQFASSTGAFATSNLPIIDNFVALGTQTTSSTFNLVGAISAADLSVSGSSITVNGQSPADAIGITGQDITIGYTVQNLSPGAAEGNWNDSVYLSTSDTLSANAFLLGRVSHTGNLAGLSSYTGTLTASVPGVVNGNYEVIVVTDSQIQIPDLSRANNVAASATPLSIQTQALTLGTPVTASISNGQDAYYLLDLTSDSDVHITGTYSVAGEANVFVSYGVIPTSSDYNEAATDPSSLYPTINLAQPQGGDYYILIQGQSAAGSGLSFTLSAVVSSFAIDSFSPSLGSNAGNATLTVTGADFTTQTVVQLSGPGGTVAAPTVEFQDDTTLYATFDLTGLTLGTYAVQAVENGNEAVTASSTFQVVTGNPGQLQDNIATYEYVRPNQTGTTATVYYSNIGDTDIPAPLLTVEATNAVLGYADQSGYVGSTIQILGINQNGPAGILPPGYQGSITLNYQPTTEEPHTEIDFYLYSPADASIAIDWSSLESAANPDYITASAWSAIWGNFTSIAGSTVGQYQAYLDDLATYFSQIGDSTSDVETLYNYAIYLANASLPVTASIASADAAVPTPGLALTFERTYQPTISGRYQLGPLGYGWTDNWQISASTDSQGDVTVDDDGIYLYFAKEASGGYLTPVGDVGSLTLVDGGYQLLQTDGTVIAFNADGDFDYIEDSDGNRIIAGYSDGDMTSLTDSNGAFLTLAYTAQGLLSNITDSNGQVTNYTYDTTNQLLLSVSSPAEAEQYTYVTDPNAAQQNALATITKTDGTHVYLTYDYLGRLTDQQGCLCSNNPIEHLVYSYGTGGTVTTTDNDGDATVEMTNAFGEPAVTEDALGQITRDYYDENGNLIRQVSPNGTTETYTYDANGNLLTETDPLGETTTFTYDTNNNVTSETDANGVTTAYSYNSHNDLLSITYANGAEDQFTYNPLGEATQFLNADGDAIGSTYNVDGQLTGESFGNGTSYAYAYDQYGNLTSATDALGNVTTFVYGGTNDGDPTDPDLLSEVIYPDQTYLEFFYDTGGQRVESVDQTGFTVNYSYDDAGRLSELTDGAGNLIAKYTYNAIGLLSQTDNGNGTRTSYTYDADGNTLSIINYAPDHVTVNSFDDYTYDSAGNILTGTNHDGMWIYAYDADGRLIQAIFTPNSSDPDGMTSQDLEYAYDAVGNRISETDNGVVTTYSVNAVNEYTSSTTAGVGATTYQYDADGNLIAMTAPGSATTDYTYNPLNELTGISGSGLSASYAFDPLGNLVSQTVNGSTTNYQIDPIGLGNVVATFSGTGLYNDSGGILAHYTYGTGLTSQVSASGATAYYDFDLTGNTIGMTNFRGQYINVYTYLPFGLNTTVAAAASNPFTYVGKSGVISQDDGLDVMRARFYSGITGSFLSLDPLGLAGGGTNLYTYADQNPISLVDPTGLAASNPDPLPTCRTESAQEIVHDIEEDNAEINGIKQQIESAYHSYKLGNLSAAAFAELAIHYGDAIDVIRSQIAFLYALLDVPVCKPPTPPPPPPPTPPTPKPPSPKPTSAVIKTGGDPNDIVGPTGYGADGFLSPGQTMPFRIDFENEASATAPPQIVLVTEQLDPNLDWSTFRLGDFSISGVTYAVPAGLTSYSTRLNLVATAGVYLEVSALFDETTGLLTWTFTSLDPVTLDVPVGDPEEGFLPPDVVPPEGDAWISYTVEPKATDVTGTVINAQATVYFNYGLSDQSSLATSPIFNTIDAGAPTSSVASLPATSLPSFTVSWSGQEDSGGSGIASYNVYVSDDGGPFTGFKIDTTATSAAFTGQVGHTYAFYSIATDNVGNAQPAPSAPQATTEVVSPLTITSGTSISPNPRNLAVSEVGVSLSELASPAGFSDQALTLIDNGGPNLITSAVTVTPTTGTSYTISGLSGLTAAEGEYTLTVSAADISDPYGYSGTGTLSISWLMDTTPPTSTIGTLPAQTTSTRFVVSASGSDPGAHPSGIAYYTLFDAVDTGPFTPFATVLPGSASATFTGQIGDTYHFYSLATDNAGNTQPVPENPQQSVQILSPLTVSAIEAVTPNPRNTMVGSITVSFSEPINPASLTPTGLTLTDNGGPDLITGGVSLSLVSGSTYQVNGLSSLTTANGQYTFTVSAAGLEDSDGNAGSGSASTMWLMDTAPPTSTVSPLPARESALTFPVSISAGDAGNPASGLALTNIYESTNGGPWYFWTTLIAPAMTANFSGQSNMTYSFYSAAEDYAGNVQVQTPVVEASTYVPNLTPPVTSVNGTTGANPSTVNTSTGTFTLNLTGTDPGGGLIEYFMVYVKVDNGNYQELGPYAIPAGAASNGTWTSSIVYQGLTDGLTHTYSFYSVAVDSNGNQQAAPASPNVTFSNQVFGVPSALQVTGFTIEHGSPGRSFIQYLDIGFNETGNALTNIVNSISTSTPLIQVYKYDLNDDASSKTAVPLNTSPTILDVIDHAIEINFGSNGIGGTPASTTPDGYYEVDIKLPSGQTSVHHFYRLLGDVDGDQIVDQNDLNQVAASIAESAAVGWAPLSADVTGGGTVTALDLTVATRSKGHALKSGLSLG